MAKPVYRDGFDTVKEAAWGATKYGALATVGSFIVGAVAAAAVVAAGAAIVGGVGALGAAAGAASIPLIGGMFSGASVAGALTTAFTGTGAVITGVFAALSGASTAAGGGLVATGIAAVVGAFSGANKASKGNAAYAAKMREASMNPQAEIINAQNAGMQQGYAVAVQQLQGQAQQILEEGRNQGRAEVLQKLQAAHHEPAHAGHAANLKKHESHTAGVEASKQAAATHGVGV